MGNLLARQVSAQFLYGNSTHRADGVAATSNRKKANKLSKQKLWFDVSLALKNMKEETHYNQDMDQVLGVLKTLGVKVLTVFYEHLEEDATQFDLLRDFSVEQSTCSHGKVQPKLMQKELVKQLHSKRLSK